MKTYREPRAGNGKYARSGNSTTYSWKRRMEGLVVVRPMNQLMSRVDDVVAGAIRNGSLGPESPYLGWSVEKFEAQRGQHIVHKKALVESRQRNSASHLLDPR